MLLKVKDKPELKKTLERIFPLVMEWEGYTWEHDLFEDVFETMWNDMLDKAYDHVADMGCAYLDKEGGRDDMSDEADKISEEGLNLAFALDDSDFPLYLQVDIWKDADGPEILFKAHRIQKECDVDDLVKYIKEGLGV